MMMRDQLIKYLKSSLICCLLINQTVGAQEIPLDPAVRMGKLANGLTYYIRHNTEPEGRAQLYLVNKVGSVLEDDDQQGLAHFMEHMNFNGTKHFPKNELVNTLQKAGVRFGADLNAYTTFDETVYKLPIPTDEGNMLEEGLNILRDWAHEALLDSLEVEKERGIILEEERLRKGVDDRMSRQYFPMLLNHSRYTERLPIGLDDILLHAPVSTIRRFYEDWYRPDLQALIVVGDVDVNQVEDLIRKKFSDIQNPKNERPRTVYSIPLNGKNQFQQVTDPEKGETSLQVFHKFNETALVSEEDYKQLIRRQLLNQMLATRRHELISQEANPAYINANASVQPLLAGISAFTFDLTAKNGRLKEGFQQLYRFIERVKRFGFTTADLETAKQTYLRNMEKAFNERNKTPSVNYTTEYQNLFLKQEAAPGIEWEYTFSKKYIPEIKLEEVNGLAKEYLQPVNRDVLILAPSAVKDSLPDENTILAWMDEVVKEKLVAFEDKTIEKPLLPILPEPGKVITQKFDALLGTTELTLSNGVRVVLKPTDFKNDEIRFGAYSKGGTSLYSDEDFYNAFNAAPLISSFGIGDFNPAELAKLLQGKIVGIQTGIEARSQIVRGSAAPVDLETALQLTYLMFTSPRKDPVIFQNTIDRTKEGISARYANPINVFSDTISYVMGSYNYRAEPPTVAKVASIDLDKAYEIYKERFSDASGFSFVFVGNFDVVDLIPLLEKYIGSLPSTYKDEEARDLGIHIPNGKIVKKVYQGAENKATVQMVLSGDYRYSPENNLRLKALGDILQIKMLEELRESEGEVYSPTVQVSFNKLPKNRFALMIQFGCDPKNVDHLIGLVEQELMEMREVGISPAELEKFKVAYIKNVELVLKENGFWLGYLLGQYENGEDPKEVLSLRDRVDKLDSGALQEAAKIFLSGDNTIHFELLPTDATEI